MVEAENKNDAVYFKFVGELDESCALKVKNYMDDVIEYTKIKKFVMDLKKLTFMDSTGIGILIGRYKKITKKNGVVFISAPQPVVDKVLTLSGIYQIMPKIEE